MTSFTRSMQTRKSSDRRQTRGGGGRSGRGLPQDQDILHQDRGDRPECHGDTFLNVVKVTHCIIGILLPLK